MSSELINTDHSKANLILYFLAGFFALLSKVTAEDVYDWTFKLLSLISIIMIIIINYPKLIKAIREIKTLLKKNC